MYLYSKIFDYNAHRYFASEQITSVFYREFFSKTHNPVDILIGVQGCSSGKLV